MIRLTLALISTLLAFTLAACSSSLLPASPLPPATATVTGLATGIIPTSKPEPTYDLLSGTATIGATPSQEPESLPSATAVQSPPAPVSAVENSTATPVPTASPTAEPTPCVSGGRIETGSYLSPLAGQMAYRVYLPPCYGLDGRTYPALYLLPGNIHTDSIWDELGIDETAEETIRAGAIAPLIIVMADGGRIANETSGGPFSFEGVFIDSLIPHIESHYCARGDAGGRAVGGLSRGGYWALEIAFRQPHLFRSVGGHSAALVDTHAGPAEDPISTGVQNDLGNLRILLDMGANDPYLSRARLLHETLEAYGVPHNWLINDGGHGNEYWTANLAKYLTWYDEGWTAPANLSPDCPTVP